jgi:hypothetical protein
LARPIATRDNHRVAGHDCPDHGRIGDGCPGSLLSGQRVDNYQHPVGGPGEDNVTTENRVRRDRASDRTAPQFRSRGRVERSQGAVLATEDHAVGRNRGRRGCRSACLEAPALSAGMGVERGKSPGEVNDEDRPTRRIIEVRQPGQHQAARGVPPSLNAGARFNGQDVTAVVAEEDRPPAHRRRRLHGALGYDVPNLGSGRRVNSVQGTVVAADVNDPFGDGRRTEDGTTRYVGPVFLSRGGIKGVERS